PHDACGFLPIGGLLTAGLRHGLAIRPLELTTSADTAGEPERGVGYGRFTLGLPAPGRLEEVEWLAARGAPGTAPALRAAASCPLGQAGGPDAVRSPGVSCVALERGEDVVGCSGSLEPRRALWRDVARNARGAAFEDPRFSPLAAAEREGITVEVSVLSP